MLPWQTKSMERGRGRAAETPQGGTAAPRVQDPLGDVQRFARERSQPVGEHGTESTAVFRVAPTARAGIASSAAVTVS